ncbi:MAG: 30S ribosomal protein S6 [Candidatus Omnitrophica bacterium]|nr:30S ribosomal protein S6 [Candidatus Omnitrophota bacterium]
MKSYEGIFIFPPDQSTDAQKNNVQQVEELIKKFKGSVTGKTEYGKKQLGYSIRKFREAQMVFLEFQMDPSQATEFRKALQFQENLIKFMVTIKRIRPSKLPVAKTAAPPTGQGHRPAPVSH